MKKFILWVVIIATAFMVVNSKTDFFRHFGDYAPAIEEKFPDAVITIEEASGYVYDFTGYLPTWGELMAILKNEEMPIDPQDVAVNAYIENSPMLTFYPYENVSAKIKDGKLLRLFGVTDKKHLVIRFSDAENEKLDQVTTSVNSEGEFDKTIEIPKSDADKISVEIYTGEKAYGDFRSWIYNYLYLTKDENGAWKIMTSPVYTHNKALYEKERAVSEALKATPAIECDEKEIQSLAKVICANAQTDYDKLLSIHKWVCSNIRYDRDSLNQSETVPYAALKVLKNKKAVCLGFSTLTASLCRSVGIPCNVVSGYALGIGEDTQWSEKNVNTIEQNHAWNEAYVDGRWVILDTTWDCMNKIENGEEINGEPMHTYFDANIDFFSANHKIIEYMRRP